MRRLLIGLLVVFLTFAVVTAWALESGGVAILNTSRSDGSVRSTHVWYAESAGGLWIEAATEQREFLADIRRQPRVTLLSDGHSAPYHVEILTGADAHRQVRELLRHKYGWRDWWVGLLQDTSASVALRLNDGRD